MTTTSEALTAYWRQAGDDPDRFINPEVLIEHVERLYKITLPADFREYLLQAAPKDDLWDRGDVIRWSPTRLKSIPDEYEQAIHNSEIGTVADKCIFFADYMIWCWAWAICCDEGEHRGKVAFISGPDSWVASSFTEFVSAYIRNPDWAARVPVR